MSTVQDSGSHTLEMNTTRETMDGLPHRGVEHAEVSTVQGSGSHTLEVNTTRETMDGLPHRGVEHAEVSTVQGSRSHTRGEHHKKDHGWLTSQRGGTCRGEYCAG